MRVAAYGFEPSDTLHAAVAMYARVKLDGIELMDGGLMAADEEAGTVEVVARDAVGVAKADEHGRPTIETLRGKVEISIATEAPDANRRCYDILRAREAESACHSGAAT